MFHYKIINFLFWGTALVQAGSATYIQYILYMTILKSKRLNFETQLAPSFDRCNRSVVAFLVCYTQDL